MCIAWYFQFMLSFTAYVDINMNVFFLLTNTNKDMNNSFENRMQMEIKIGICSTYTIFENVACTKIQIL